MRASSRAFCLFCTIGTTACTPSHRLVHEGDRYFERCYGADFTADLRRNTKEACWQAWIAHYTKFQPAHRVDYALARIEALQNGEAIPTLPELGRRGPPAFAEADAGAATNTMDPSTPWAYTPMFLGDGGAVPHGCTHYCADYGTRCDAHCSVTNLACQQTCARERSFCLSACY